MKKFFITLIFGMAAAVLWAQDSAVTIESADLPANPGEELKTAIAQLAARDNYSWTETNRGVAGGAEGKVNRQGLLYVVRNNGTEQAMMDGKLVRKTSTGWKRSLAGPGRQLGGVARNFLDPTVEARDILSHVTDIKMSEPGVYKGELTEAGAQTLVVLPDSSVSDGFQLTGLKGTVLFRVKEGALRGYEYHLEGRCVDATGERPYTLTHTTEIKDISATQVEIPPAAFEALH